jgi:hypothetical protein
MVVEVGSLRKMGDSQRRRLVEKLASLGMAEPSLEVVVENQPKMV